MNDKLQHVLLALALVFSVTFKRLAPIFIILLALWVVFNRKDRTAVLKVVHASNPLLWLFFFYLYHLLAMLWSTNLSFGWNDLGIKASFFIFPILFALGKFNVDRDFYWKVLLFGLSACVVVFLLFASWQSWYYPEDNQWGYFFEHEFSIWMHRSYFATYTAVAASISLFWLLSGRSGQQSLLLVTCFIFLSVATFLTLSKAGILIWFTLNLFVVLRVIRHKSKWIGITMVSALILFSSLILLTDNKISSRMGDLKRSIHNFSMEKNKSVESSAARILMWYTSIECIREQALLGTGTGDVKDVLVNKSLELGNTGCAERKLNAHNQYLNTTVQLGIIGLLLLLAVISTTFRFAAQTKQFELVLLMTAFTISMLFESFLETQAGIIPFALFICLFTYRNSEDLILK